MADTIDTTPHIQYEEETNPPKAAGEAAYSTERKDVFISEKAEDYDLEEKAARIADADLNAKKKQVWVHWDVIGFPEYWSTLLCRPTQDGCSCGLRTNQPELYTGTLEPGMYLFPREVASFLNTDLLIVLSTSTRPPSRASQATMTLLARFLSSSGH